MAQELVEYTVRDYSAVDKQIDEIARRERILTNRLNIENLKKFILIGLIVVGGICILLLSLALAYRIAFPPEKKVLENPLPVEITIKNEPIVIKEESIKIVRSDAPSNKIFGIKEKNKTVKAINEDSTSNSKVIYKDQIKKQSRLDNTSVVTFLNKDSFLTGFRDVTTGWNWKTPNSDKPYKQYCYIMNLDRVQIDLATINGGTKKSLYNSNKANKYNLSKNQWNSLENKCQWFSN